MLETTFATPYVPGDEPEAAFTDDAFLVLRSRHFNARVKIRFEEIGGRCETVGAWGLPPARPP